MRPLHVVVRGVLGSRRRRCCSPKISMRSISSVRDHTRPGSALVAVLALSLAAADAAAAQTGHASRRQPASQNIHS
jgi:hypothetical protein